MSAVSSMYTFFMVTNAVHWTIANNNCTITPHHHWSIINMCFRSNIGVIIYFYYFSIYLKLFGEIMFYFNRDGRGFMWKSIFCVRLSERHIWLHSHPRPSSSHQTKATSRGLLLLWVSICIILLPSPPHLKRYFGVCLKPALLILQFCFYPQLTMKAW